MGRRWLWHKKPPLWGDGDGTEGTAGAVDDFERGGDDDGTGGGQLIEVAKAGEAKLSAAMHDEMIGEGRVKFGGLARVGSHCFDTDAQNVALPGEKFRGFLGPAGSVRAVFLEVDVLGGIGAPGPSGAKEHPGSGRDFSVRGFPLLD